MKHTTDVKSILEKLLYFAEIGEKYTISLEESTEIIEKLNKINTRRRFKVSQDLINKYAVIWRSK